jgi:hypothetical protein
MQALGFGEVVDFDGSTIRIHSRVFRSRDVADVEFAVFSVTSLELIEATRWWHGYLRFVIDDAQPPKVPLRKGELGLPRGRRSAYFDPYAVMYRRKEAPQIVALKIAVEGALADGT